MSASVALATSEKWPGPHPDDVELIAELARLGINASPAVWSDAAVDWRQFDVVVIRSCWDYHLRLGEFLRWIGTLERVYNPAGIIRWNSDKSYLRHLPAEEFAIPVEIATAGEWSLIFFDRVFSHAIHTRPNAGSAQFADAPNDLIAGAQRILDAVDGDVLYARVDVVQHAGIITLAELNLIEPMLFLVGEPHASLRFARAIARRLELQP